MSNFYFRSCIAVFKDESDCTQAEADCKEKTLEGRAILCSPATSEDCAKLLEECSSEAPKTSMEGLQIKLFNLPYNTTEAEIKKLFPRTRHIFLPKTKDGNPSG